MTEKIITPPTEKPTTITQQQYNELLQQNNTLRNILQGLIPLLDKFQRAQSTQLGSISNGIEQLLNTLPKPTQIKSDD